jgi:FkbM family methyltransferase
MHSKYDTAASKAEYIEICYKFLLGREPDKAGREAFERYLGENPDISAHEFANLFIQSPEFSSRHPRQALTSMSEEVMELTINGHSLFINKGDWVYEGARSTGEYEPWVANAISSNLPESGVFLDLGANIGVHSALASSKVGPNGRVYAFEASIENAALIRKSSRAFNRTNIVVVAMALSDRTGVAQLSFDDVGSNRFLASEGDPVLTAPLDALLPELGRLDVIKIDVEGHERSVLEGAKQTIAKFNPKIVAEYLAASHQKGFASDLLSMGYVVQVLSRDGSIGAFHSTTQEIDRALGDTPVVIDVLFTNLSKL